MSPDALTPDRILEATAEVLRRYGPAKATVVDVARALGVSHGSVYRHFPSKTALREAVTSRWLDLAHEELADVADSPGPATARLRTWLSLLFGAKRSKAGMDPELFATYMTLVSEHSGVVDRHIETLVAQLRTIVEAGLAQGEFTTREISPDPGAVARAVWDATVRFHDPVYAEQWSSPSIQAEFSGVVRLVLAGLGTA